MRRGCNDGRMGERQYSKEMRGERAGDSRSLSSGGIVLEL